MCRPQEVAEKRDNAVILNPNAGHRGEGSSPRARKEPTTGVLRPNCGLRMTVIMSFSTACQAPRQERENTEGAVALELSSLQKAVSALAGVQARSDDGKLMSHLDTVLRFPNGTVLQAPDLFVQEVVRLVLLMEAAGSARWVGPPHPHEKQGVGPPSRLG